MKLGIIGAGTVARLVLEHVRAGDLGDARVVAVLARSASARGLRLAQEFDVSLVTSLNAFIDTLPDVVVEAASHQAVRDNVDVLLRRGITVVVLSSGALCDDALRTKVEQAAQAGGALLYVPSGGIAGLDALKAAYVAGVEEVTIAVTKPPAAWKDIPYVSELRIDLDRLSGPRTLYDGSARQGVPLFPANVNIAAALCLAGIGFDRTRLKVVADPALTHNTHFIEIRGRSGNISIKVENVPAPDNPKTAWLACYSAIAALKLAKSNVRYGT
jgi:aspartate dehydrogenase